MVSDKSKEYSQRLKILFVLPSLKVGGAERIVYLLCKELNKQHEVFVVSLFSGGKLLQEFESLSILLKVFENRRSLSNPFKWLTSLYISVSNLIRIINDIDPDIINLHLFGPELDLFLATKVTSKKNVFVTIHNTYPEFNPDTFIEWIRKLRIKYIYSCFRHFIVVSSEVKKWLIENNIVQANKISVIKNGIDIERFKVDCSKDSLREEYGFSRDQKIFINVASLSEKKGHEILLESIKLLPRIYKEESLFLIVGDGPERERIKEIIQSFDLSDYVKLLGLRDDIPRLLEASDIFVLSSFYEGLPMVILEAMASGLPVISTEVSGSVELIEHKINGLLVPIGDPMGLSNAIKYCIDYGDKTKMGKLGSELVHKKFSSVNMAEEYETTFQSIMNDNYPG